MLKVAWAKEYIHPLPKSHRFPMSKYELLPEQLMHEGTLERDNFFTPKPLSEKHILLTHEHQYWEKLKYGRLTRSEERKTGFPFSPALITREITIAQGTLTATDYALQYGCAMNIAGGTHHAFTNRGEGFCLLNDMAIGANYLLSERKVGKILVIDLDVHQGNGTAQIFADDSRVFTFSMHGANNYPLHKEQSDLDVPLPNGTSDEAYLALLEEHLSNLFETEKPEFVFFQSGVDVLATDRLGKLALTMEGCKMRDRLVLLKCQESNIPIVVTMGGGYSERFLDIIEAHANTYRLAQEIFF